MYSKLKENHLIEKLKLGEIEAYNYLAERYHHRLCTYAFGLTNDRFEAEDIVQNVFLRIWEKREHLRSEFSIKNYLYKSVYNEFIDFYRKQKPVFSLEKKYIEALSVIIENETEQTHTELLNLVKKEISNLSPKCQRIFLLSKEEGLTNLEIAEYLKISNKTVENQITIAFKKIRKKLIKTLPNKNFLLLIFSPKSYYYKYFG